jgi:MFS family permease
VYRYTRRDVATAPRPRAAENPAAENPRPENPRPENPRPEKAGAEAFRRDAPTLIGYLAIAGYAFWLYAFGPALTLLRAELHFSYTLVGLYSALWSAGAVVTGFGFARLARRLPRNAVLWWSAAGSVAGVALFTAGRTVPLTLAGAALTGLAGATLLTCAQAVLSDRHGDGRDRALTEANVLAAGCAVLAPLLLGLLQDTPATWRPVFGLPVLLLVGMYLRYRRQPLPAATARHPDAGRLPLACWLLAGMTAIGVAIEFCPVYFGAELLTSTGLRATQAATAISAFYLGILVGRVGGAWLTRRAGRTVPVLWGSLAVTAAGFVLFWLAGLPAPAIAGLFACGLGLANLYPLSLALAMAAAPGHGDTANARVGLLGGVIVIAAPYLLGSLADHVGLRAAFTVEPALIGACAVLLLAGLRLAQHPAK